MPFTDDDLKRLKESLSGELPKFSYWAKADLQVIVNLIARLEAAEQVIKDVDYCGSHKCDPWPCPEIIMNLKRWRVIAGKS